MLEDASHQRGRLPDDAVAPTQIGSVRLEGLGQGDQGGAHRHEDGLTLGPVGERLAQHVEAERVVADEQVLLGREVPEQRARRHDRAIGDLLDGHRVEAPLEEEGQGRRPDALVALLSVPLAQTWCGAVHRAHPARCWE